MQITLDTTNLSVQDKQILAILLGNTQPVVVQNTGSTASESPSPTEGSAVSEPVEATASPAAPVKRGRKPKAEPTDDTSPSESAPPVQEEAAAPSTPDADKVPAASSTSASLDDVRAALQKYTQGKGVPAGIELLKEFGAARISELKEESYGAFIGRCA